jgi:hypothetical protein
MDFISRLPRSRKDNDVVWVFVDRLIKSVLFLPIKMTDLVDKLTKLYVDEVVRLHGVKVSIISDKTLVYFKIVTKVTISDGDKSTLQYSVSSSK